MSSTEATSSFESRSTTEPSACSNAFSTRPQITIFTIPKAFEGHFGLIQRNAVRSWLALGMDVILFGDDPGVAETAAELGARHFGGMAVNEHGTPLLSDAFRLAHEHSDSPLIAYCNADVILLKDFVSSVASVAVAREDESESADESNFEGRLNNFLIIGRRTNLAIEREIDFENRENIQDLLSQVKTQGQLDSIVCKEYFVFNRELFTDVPAFAVGRGNWDNWMVSEAKSKDIAVVDVTKCVQAIHQRHDYSHTGSTRMACYVSGVEARENQRLAGGRNWVRGSTADWSMNSAGDISRRRVRWMHLGFWCDLPKFSKLIFSLFSSR